MYTIEETRNYSLFKFMKKNRELDRKNIEKIKESMSKRWFLNPILVDLKMNIVDGQHRFYALMELGRPIHYLKFDYKEEDIITLNNARKGWDTKNYFGFYDLEDYEFIKNVHLSTSIPYPILINIVKSDNGKKLNEYKNGLYKIENKVLFMKYVELILEFKSLNKKAVTNQFVRALNALFKSSQFDPQKLIKKAINNPTLFYKCHNTETYKNMLLELYNYRERTKLELN